MRERFDKAFVQAEGVFDEFLAVAGDGAAGKGDAFSGERVYLGQPGADDLDGVAFVGVIILIQQAVILADDNEFGGGTAAVDADIRLAPISGKVAAGALYRYYAHGKG